MQKPAEREGVFRIPSTNENEEPLRAIHEISDAYQRARRRFSRVSVVSSGKSAAYALLLAERFTPDDVRIAPLRDGGEAFFRTVRPFRRSLFAVLADITVYVTEKDSSKEIRKLRRLLRPMRSREKRIIVLRDEREVDLAVKKQVLFGANRKTLA